MSNKISLSYICDSLLYEKYKTTKHEYFLKECKTIMSLPNSIKIGIAFFENQTLQLVKNNPDVLFEDKIHKINPKQISSADGKTLNMLRNFENVFNKYIQLPLSVLAAVGGGIAGYAAGSNLTRGQSPVARLSGRQIGRIGGIVGGYSIGQSAGNMLQKVVRYIVEKKMTMCRRLSDDKQRSKCITDSYDSVLRQIKSEMSKCESTSRPEACKNKLQGEYKKYISKREESLKESK